MQQNLRVAITSNFPTEPSPEVVAAIRSASRQPRVAWIAPQRSSRHLRFPMARRSFRRFGVSDLEFVDAGRVSTEWGILDRFDAIYLTGGNPLRFRQALIASGLGRAIRGFAEAGRLVVAASGGAMQLTPNVSLFRLRTSDVADVVATREAFAGMALVDVEILPHLDSHNAAFMTSVEAYSRSLGHDLLALADGAGILHEGGKIRPFGHVVRYRAGLSTTVLTR